MDITCIINEINPSDVISLGLGVLSLVLGITSVIQSWKYKKIDEKIDKDREQIINDIQNKSDVVMKELSDLSYKLIHPNAVDLHKDKLRVYKTSKYNARNASDIINKLDRELPIALKQVYINSLAASLNLDNFSVEDNLIDIVTLKHKYKKDDVDKIKELNESFSEDGIRFELV